MEAALAAAAVKRQKKKAAEIEAAAKKTEEDRVKKNVYDHHLEEQEADWLDNEKKERIAIAAAKTEEDREERNKRASLATTTTTTEQQQEAEWLDKEKQERIQAGLAQFEEERKNKRAAAGEQQQEAEWLDKEKQERIQAAAQRAEEERLAKLHRDNEEAHKWKRPANLGLGKGLKPPAFQSSQGLDSRNSYVQPKAGGHGGGTPPQLASRGEVVHDHLVRPKDVIGTGSIRKFELSTTPVDHQPTTAESSTRQKQSQQPMEGVTQEDLKKYARELNLPAPTMGTVEHNATHYFVEPTATRTPPSTTRTSDDVAQVVSTEEVNDDGVKVSTTHTVTYSTERLPVEKSQSPQQSKSCCIIL
jgi:hypothetical protein